MSLAPPLALVTGAARGIGQATVKRLLAAGLRVIALDRDTAGLAQLARPDGPDLLTTCRFDLTDIAGTGDQLAGLVDEHGPITHLVLNAGVGPGSPIVTMRPTKCGL